MSFNWLLATISPSGGILPIIMWLGCEADGLAPCLYAKSACDIVAILERELVVASVFFLNVAEKEFSRNAGFDRILGLGTL